MVTRREVIKAGALGLVSASVPRGIFPENQQSAERAASEFLTPPDACRPWVYWYFMDGNLTREGMKADLEALKQAGVGGAIYLEVGLGIERGPVEFMSDPWQQLLGEAFQDADRLGLQIALTTGPGWCGTGGPWIKPENSMQHLVASQTLAHGPSKFDALLVRPKPRTPFFGEETLNPALHQIWKDFYLDVVLLAFPSPLGRARIPDAEEKALYFRPSYSSQMLGSYPTRPAVRPSFPTTADHPALPGAHAIPSGKVIDLSGKLTPEGRLVWDVPPGDWTILRFGRTTTGQTTRPAPAPGLGFEADKFDSAAADIHFEAFIGSLLKKTGEPRHAGRGLTTLHFDSWEMSSQNWSSRFREEFRQRRGYDLAQYLPTFLGYYVDDEATSERFLWDFRQTAQELVVGKHLARIKQLGQRHGLQLSLEPYDLNPCADLTLGSVADVPMGEFWSKGWDFKTDFSLIEATAVGHTQGHNIIGAEAFTALKEEQGQQYPGSMKAQGDWAFCAGINRFVIHRYQSQPWLNRYPGMMMGTDGYGVDWQRTQTWWEMAPAYHLYLSRCQHMLRRGLFVADILYLALEGAPNVFLPPRSATRAGVLRDRRGYNFDGCAPGTLIERASVKEGRIVFPDGMSYQLLVLPRSETMTPQLLEKILLLVEEGATILGAPPRQSPSLANFPRCDERVAELAAKLWGRAGNASEARKVGKGTVFFDRGATPVKVNPLAPAQWVWSSQPDASTSATRYFRRNFHLEDKQDDKQRMRSAEIVLTANGSFDLYVNGKLAGSADDLTLHTIDIASLLKPGDNTLLLIARRSSSSTRETAGIVGSLTAEFTTGERMVLYTDHQWEVATAEHGSYVPASEFGGAGASGWDLYESAFEAYETYPNYDLAAQILAQMGIAPDFEGGENVRHIHRRDSKDDLYFIANTRDEVTETTCHLRVSGRQPEWWDPLTGTSRLLPRFSEHNGITTLTLRLDPAESGFVIFREVTQQAKTAGQNFLEISSVVTLQAPWDVSFDPAWGGPAHVQFIKLQDWTTRAEFGIKHYSGRATYQTSFDLPLSGEKATHYVTLGKVKNLASITLNGHDLGVVWCAPWRVAIPAGLLRERDNILQVVVANLWTNRLIADSGLAPDQRLTWITRNPFHPDSTLLESGLLGPVEIQRSFT